MDSKSVQQRRKELSNKLPDLAARVFAVRQGKAPLMKGLGHLMHRLNDYDTPYSRMDLALDEVLFEDLTETVLACERFGNF